MDKKTDKKQREVANVEFGIEFGGMNASKLYEIPFMNQEKSKKNNNKC
ncbi:hypothetical protein BGM26_01040 [Bacillus sp. FJAT-29790]|nr:hypothetical protein [Bacillus sp. FJAT-29790]MBU8877573.1 hypothetical protein [Bacillus sp. FJAT-29790]